MRGLRLLGLLFALALSAGTALADNIAGGAHTFTFGTISGVSDMGTWGTKTCTTNTSWTIDVTCGTASTTAKVSVR